MLAAGVPINSQCTLFGPYVVPNHYSEFTAVFTTLPIVCTGC